MTKEEIKLIKDQQAQIEKGYRYQIKQLEEKVQEAENNARASMDQITELLKENDYLRNQIQHLQSGLTGEELSAYEE